MSLAQRYYQITNLGTTHTNTTTEAAFTSYLTIPASDLRVGDRLEFGATVEATATNSTDTLTCILCIGTARTSRSTGIQLATTPASDVADGNVMSLKATARVTAIGAAGTAALTYTGEGWLIGATPALVTSGDKAGTLATYFATTSDLYVFVIADWSAASTGDVATLVDLWCRITPALPSV